MFRTVYPAGLSSSGNVHLPSPPRSHRPPLRPRIKFTEVPGTTTHFIFHSRAIEIKIHAVRPTQPTLHKVADFYLKQDYFDPAVAMVSLGHHGHRRLSLTGVDNPLAPEITINSPLMIF